MDEMLAEVVGPIVATEMTPEAAAEQAIADLDRRIRELEAAIGDLRSVKASAAGRKTVAAGAGRGECGVDDALRSLSPEQRIAVKSGLMRAGLM